LQTPVHNWCGREIDERVAPATQVNLKLELFQHSGTFKARGVVSVMRRLSPEALARGVTAVSAGNHAIATAYVARALGSATLRAEWLEQAGPLDAVVIPVGGGGLCAGVSAAIKLNQPRHDRGQSHLGPANCWSGRDRLRHCRRASNGGPGRIYKRKAAQGTQIRVRQEVSAVRRRLLRSDQMNR
jgi:hypothetical protein